MRTKGYIKISKEELQRKYEEGMSVVKIAEEFFVTYGTILNRLKEYDIPHRGYRAPRSKKKVRA